MNLFIDDSNYNTLITKAEGYYDKFTKTYLTIDEGGNINNNDTIDGKIREKTKTIHGKEHCKAVVDLADKLNNALEVPEGDRNFTKLLAAYHDSSRLHEREDKEEMGNAQIFYNETKDILGEEERILGGLLIALKGQLSNIKAEKNADSIKVINEFVTGTQDRKNNIEITQKTSSPNAQEWLDLIKTNYLGHLQVLNLADTLDVIRVRFANKNDTTIPETEHENFKLKFTENGTELNLDVVLKKVDENKRDAVQNIAKKHINKVVNEEKRYFPKFRELELRLNALKGALKDYKDVHSKELGDKAKNIEDFSKEMTGESFHEMRSLINYIQGKDQPIDGKKAVIDPFIKKLQNSDLEVDKNLATALTNWKASLNAKKTEEENFVKRNKNSVSL